jgi:low affinity Fe/Cu permease
VTFSGFASSVSKAAGKPVTFAIALGSIALWAATGPVFGFSEGWQMVVNTGTTIVTFLMVFALQHTQNRESQAINARLDELIRAIPGARNALIVIDADPEADIEALRCKP